MMMMNSFLFFIGFPRLLPLETRYSFLLLIGRLVIRSNHI